MSTQPSKDAKDACNWKVKIGIATAQTQTIANAVSKNKCTDFFVVSLPKIVSGVK